MAKKAVFTGLVAAAATPDAPPADDERFRQAQDWVTSVAVPRQLLSSDAVLRLYGAFKQATSGAAPLRGPSRWDLRARAKWEAWSAMRPLEAEAAIRLYCTLVEDHRLQVDGAPADGRAGANVGTAQPTAAAPPRDGPPTPSPAAAHVDPAAAAPTPAHAHHTAESHHHADATAAANEAAAAAAAASAALPGRSRVVAFVPSASGPTLYVIESVQLQPGAAGAGGPGAAGVVPGTCVVHRRFSDFRTLHSAIREAVGLPHAFPLRRAVLNNDHLRKRRVLGLSAYLSSTLSATRAALSATEASAAQEKEQEKAQEEHRPGKEGAQALLHRTRCATAILVNFLTHAIPTGDAPLAITTAGHQGGGSASKTDPARSQGSNGRERGHGNSDAASRSAAAARHAEQTPGRTTLGSPARPLSCKRSLDAQMREAADEGTAGGPAASRACSAMAAGLHEAAQRIARGVVKCLPPK